MNLSSLWGWGCLVFDGEQMHRLDARVVDAINTNGAGDMFAGAYFYSWRGETSIKAANSRRMRQARWLRAWSGQSGAKPVRDEFLPANRTGQH